MKQALQKKIRPKLFKKNHFKLEFCHFIFNSKKFTIRMNEKFESEKCVLTYLKRKQFFGTIFQILFVKNNIYFCLYIKKTTGI